MLIESGSPSSDDNLATCMVCQPCCIITLISITFSHIISFVLSICFSLSHLYIQFNYESPSDSASFSSDTSTDRGGHRANSNDNVLAGNDKTSSVSRQASTDTTGTPYVETISCSCNCINPSNQSGVNVPALWSSAKIALACHGQDIRRDSGSEGLRDPPPPIGPHPN